MGDILDLIGKIGGILAVLGIGPGLLYIRQKKRKMDAQAEQLEGKTEILYGDALRVLIGPLNERIKELEQDCKEATNQAREVNRQLAEANNTVFDLRVKCEQLEQQLDNANERALAWENHWRRTQNLPTVQLPSRKLPRK